MRKNLVILTALVLVSICSISDGRAQMFTKAKLEVTVIDGLGNPVENAIVTLYATQADYQSNENPVQSGTTQSNGKVLFKKLATDSFFIDARTDQLSNDGRGVQTGQLVKMKKSKVNIVIE